MANYNNGLTTKNNILNACKELYFEKGYNDTTFAEICAKSGVNPGSVGYHYGSKRNIASYIYKEIIEKINYFAYTLFEDEDNIQKMMIGLGLHIMLLFENAEYRRFSAQYLSENAYDEDLDEYISMVPDVYRLSTERIGKEKADFYFVAFAGMDGHIESYIDKHINELDLNNIMHYYLELHYFFLEPEEVKRRINKTIQLIQILHIKMDNFDITISK